MEEGYCYVCMTQYRVASLKVHYQNSHFRGSSCPVCGKFVTGVPNKLKIHMFRQHKIGDIERSVCTYCGKDFSSSTGLKTHIDNVHRDYVWKCKMCGKEFNSMNTAQGHIPQHSITKPWKCFLCDYSSVSKKNVGLHLNKVHKQTQQVYSRIVKTCEYQYEFEFKGSPLIKFTKPGGASDHGKKNHKPHNPAQVVPIAAPAPITTVIDGTTKVYIQQQ